MTEKEYRGSPEKKDTEGVAGKIITTEFQPQAKCLTNCNSCGCACTSCSKCKCVCNASCKSGNVRAFLVDLDEPDEDPVKLLQQIKKHLGDFPEIVEDLKK